MYYISKFDGYTGVVTLLSGFYLSKLEALDKIERIIAVHSKDSESLDYCKFSVLKVVFTSEKV